jgi:PPOX class probable F420-dependent enzyme
MSVEIPAEALDLLERPIVVTLVTVMPDGQPQATPVWFSYKNGQIWVNTARGRAKDRNMTERPDKISVLSIDPANPYRYVEVRGEVTESTEEGAVDHINELSGRYVNRPDYYGGNEARKAAETRVIYKITPTRVIYNG